MPCGCPSCRVAAGRGAGSPEPLLCPGPLRDARHWRDQMRGVSEVADARRRSHARSEHRRHGAPCARDRVGSLGAGRAKRIGRIGMPLGLDGWGSAAACCDMVYSLACTGVGDRACWAHCSPRGSPYSWQNPRHCTRVRCTPAPPVPRRTPRRTPRMLRSRRRVRPVSVTSITPPRARHPVTPRRQKAAPPAPASGTVPAPLPWCSGRSRRTSGSRSSRRFRAPLGRRTSSSQPGSTSSSRSRLPRPSRSRPDARAVTHRARRPGHRPY